MLETIAVILVLMWLLGMVSSYTMGGFVHLLLLLALVVVVVRLISGRRVLFRAPGPRPNAPHPARRRSRPCRSPPAARALRAEDRRRRHGPSRPWASR